MAIVKGRLQSLLRQQQPQRTRNRCLSRTFPAPGQKARKDQGRELDLSSSQSSISRNSTRSNRDRPLAPNSVPKERAFLVGLEYRSRAGSKRVKSSLTAVAQAARD